MPAMQSGIDGFLGVLGLTTGILFPAWPLIVIAPLQRRKRILINMTAAWGGILLLWLLSHLNSKPIMSCLIPDPQNTALFLTAGVTWIGFLIGAEFWGCKSYP